jgi:hypothetical protein
MLPPRFAKAFAVGKPLDIGFFNAGTSATSLYLLSSL